MAAVGKGVWRERSENQVHMVLLDRLENQVPLGHRDPSDQSEKR